MQFFYFNHECFVFMAKYLKLVTAIANFLLNRTVLIELTKVIRRSIKTNVTRIIKNI